ncbi:hypothetical protein ACH5RR_032437 [Cinchona calisaya]|uniref:Uncharacterized protein n=1 Tax=Cinchona calisaya TaxID=153742 RepID=A0ABD2YMB0_9GENT
MIGIRLRWFAFGFAVASTIGHFVFKDLQAHREAHFFQVGEKFSALDTRVTNLKRVFLNNPNSDVHSGESDLK